MSNQERFKSQKLTLKSQVDDFESEVNEIKKRLSSQQKEVSAAQKQISSVETKLEQKRAERHSLLKACKVCNLHMMCAANSSSIGHYLFNELRN